MDTFDTPHLFRSTECSFESLQSDRSLGAERTASHAFSEDGRLSASTEEEASEVPRSAALLELGRVAAGAWRGGGRRSLPLYHGSSLEDILQIRSPGGGSISEAVGIIAGKLQKNCRNP